ncbi:uncharacterized protein [Primulina eburnea]|uniref:uncharacterized protein n=1 Tax=Primulina eburnea TaxID=1245227 RepID=UPI003C6CBF6C
MMDSLASSNAFRPPVLDGSNSALWKVKMRMFIKSIEERAWLRVLDRWSPPRTVDDDDDDDDDDSRSKPESTWSNDEVQTSNFNSKALNAIFTSVDINMFSLITNCISAKEAWDILQKHCEGSESVRRTKLRMLTSKFENLRMEENETIVEYDRRLRDIANESFSLGDPMSNERLVSKDTSTLNLEDLISSLRTFEMNLDLQKRNTGKVFALQSTDESLNNLIQEANDSDLGEESISLITKKFGDYLKRMRDKKKTGSTPRPQSIPFERNKTTAPNQVYSRFRTNSSGRPEATKLDSVQCRECSGFGHYANECANRLRRNKNMAVSLSDDDTDEECDLKEGDDCTPLSAIQKYIYKLQVNPFGVATGVATPRRNTMSKSMCLNAKSIENTDEEELTIEIVQMMYEELYGDWLKRFESNSILSKENTDLKSSLTRLEVLLSKKDLELCRVKDELDKASMTLAKFNSSSSKLDTMINMGNEGRTGLDYIKSTYEHGESSKAGSKTTVFVKGVEDSNDPSILNPPMKIESNSKLKTPSSTCSPSKFLPPPKKPQVEKTVSALNLNKESNVLSVSTVISAWYFDSECSRHMTGSKEHLTDYIEVKSGRVTYGGGDKERIVGKRTLNVDGLPELHNVLHVEGFNSNLISISQLCDDDLHVKFNKNNCEVLNDANVCVMSGTRSADNCYLVGEGDGCRSVKLSDLDL